VKSGWQTANLKEDSANIKESTTVASWNELTKIANEFTKVRKRKLRVLEVIQIKSSHYELVYNLVSNC